MRARLAVPLSIATLAGLWLLWPSPVQRVPAHTTAAGTSPVRPAHPQPAALSSPRSVDAPPSPEDGVIPPLIERAAVVRASCGLPLQTRCEGSSCVVFAHTPAMDGLSGWLQLSWSSPAFVGSVLVRDAGVRSLPCPQAIASLDLDAIRMLPTTDGEVWCAGSGPEHRALCERATGVPGFTGETRLLRF